MSIAILAMQSWDDESFWMFAFFLSGRLMALGAL